MARQHHPAEAVPSEGGEIIPADPALRRRAVVAAAMLALAGAGLLAWAHLYLDRAGARGRAGVTPPTIEELRVLVAVVGAVLFFGLCAIATWAALLSAAILRAGAFPPPGARVLRPTRRLTGEPARARAYVGFVCALVCLAGAVTLPAMLWRLIHAIAGAPPP